MRRRSNLSKLEDPPGRKPARSCLPLESFLRFTLGRFLERAFHRPFDGGCRRGCVWTLDLRENGIHHNGAAIAWAFSRVKVSGAVGDVGRARHDSSACLVQYAGDELEDAVGRAHEVVPQWCAFGAIGSVDEIFDDRRSLGEAYLVRCPYAEEVPLMCVGDGEKSSYAVKRV